MNRMDTLAKDNSDCEIRITICATSDDKSHPLNGRWLADGPTFQPFGMVARLWAGTFNVHMLLRGGDVMSSNPREYESMGRAIRAVETRMEGFSATRGHPVDVADRIGRFLEACDVGLVWMRPVGVPVGGWLPDGQWLRLSVGETVALVRAKSAVAQKDCALANAA